MLAALAPVWFFGGEWAAPYRGLVSAFAGAWLLVATEGTNERPMLDGEPIPVLNRAGFADVPKAWIQNVHREKAS